MSSKPRDYSRYKFIVDGRIKHKGITNDLERREAEHRAKYGKGRIEQIGAKVTKDTALEWEGKQGC